MSKNSNFQLEFSKKNIVLILTILGIVSLIMKLYLADFTIPVFSDALEYTQHSIAQSHGQFLEHPQRHSGWPLFQTIFVYFINSENFLDYSNVSKFLSISISTLTILPVYLLSRKYFNSNFALLSAGIFAFEPRLIQNSTLGFSEPFFIFIMVFSIYFITKNENKSILLSFIFAGILWWIRPNGFVLFFIITIIYFAKFKFSKHTVRNFVIYLTVFSIIVSPFLFQRYEQFGDPFYSWIGERIWIGEYSHSRSILPGESYSAFDYINDFGIQSFTSKFIVGGAVSLFSTLSYMMIPLLIFFTPLGLFLYFKNKISKKNLFPIWLTLLISLVISVIPFSVIPDKRLILHLFPFLIIFAIIPIHYFFEKILFFKNKHKLFFITIFSILIITSSIMISRYDDSDPLYEQEQIDFTKFSMHHFKGKLLFEPFNTQKYFNHPIIYDNPTDFLLIKVNANWKEGDLYFNYPPTNISRISVYGKDMKELISNGEKVGLTHIMTTSESTSFFDFVNELYVKDDQYPYLEKVFDSSDFNYQKFHVKVFKINFPEFHKFYLNP